MVAGHASDAEQARSLLHDGSLLRLSGGSRRRFFGPDLSDAHSGGDESLAANSKWKGRAINRFDLLILGAGPAGMAAAVAARNHGLNVLVVDEQPSPGGQIWRSVEMASCRDQILGFPYVEGRGVARQFRASGAEYVPDAQLWQIDRGFRALSTCGGKVRTFEASTVVLAAGAQERPVPFPGWTLPGVLTVGAAQILLKNAGQIPDRPVWIAGSGPLPLLYATQLLRAGGNIAGFLDTVPRGQWRNAVPHLPAALRAVGHLTKGLAWSATLRKRVKVITAVEFIEAVGEHRIEALRYRTAEGVEATVEASCLLVHEGIVPNLHPALSLGCDIRWSLGQDCFVPALDEWGESSVPGLFIAGDGAGIAGAKAAQLRGTLAAIRIAEKLERLQPEDAHDAARAVRRRLARELSIRPFLDALYKPRAQVFQPVDSTIVCRCEEVTAGEIRASAAVGCPGPNQVKAATRAGMGLCQGRQCGYTVTRLLAEAQARSPASVGYFHVRPPLKPVTLGELASLAPRARRGGRGAFEDDPIRSHDPHVVE